MENLLTDTEAAIKLGITKELLYAYVRNAPKKHLGHDRKIVTTAIKGENYFSEEELEKFDEYLKQPWSNPKDPRPEIPKYIQDYLKTEIGGKCPISGKGYPLDNAHIVDYSVSLNHHHHNLIRVSKEEHTKADNGVLQKQVLRKSKDRLIEELRNKLKLEINKNHQYYQPPKPNPIFIGRFDKMIELIRAMENDRLVIIQGIGGVGKTQLLLNAFENVKYHNPILWFDTELIGSFDDFNVILKNALSHLASIPIIETIIDYLEEIQITIVFDSLEKLLILDRDRIESFLLELMTQTKNTQIIITSQIDLTILDHSKNVVELKALDKPESIKLLNLTLEEDFGISSENKDWLLDFSNGHPLSIKLVASLLKFFKSSDEVITRLKITGNPKNPTRSKHNKSTSLDICLSTIYDCLTKDQIKILQFVKFFPGGIKLLWAKREIEVDNFHEDISWLQQFFFLELKQDSLDFQRLVIRNPLRMYLLGRVSIEEQENEKALQLKAMTGIMIEAAIVDLNYIENEISGPASYGIIRMEEEMPNLLEAFKFANDNINQSGSNYNPEIVEENLRIIAGISVALGKFCFVSGNFENGILFSKAGIEANLKLDCVDSAATQCIYLSQLQLRQYDFEGFSKTVSDLKHLADTTCNIEVKIKSYWASGRLESFKENPISALAAFEEAAKLIQNIIKSEKKPNLFDNSTNSLLEKINQNQYVGNLALIYSEIAQVYELLDNYVEASNFFQKAIENHKKIEEEINLISCYHNYAHCLAKLDQLDKGIEYYFIAIEGFSRNMQFEYLANSLSDLGEFIENRPEIAKSELIDENSISYALDSIGYQLKHFIKRESNVSNIDTAIENIPFPLISKTIRIIQLIGFSQHRFILTDWVADLADEIDLSNIKFGLFSSVLNVGHAIGGVDYWRNLPENRPIMLKAILQGCLIINGGPDLKSNTRIFYWLAEWMKFVKLDDNATAEKLISSAWDSFN
jgi:tetratricopeptide (TPR) repeat protein